MYLMLLYPCDFSDNTLHIERQVLWLYSWLIASWYKDNMILVSILCCIAVFITEFIIGVI